MAIITVDQVKKSYGGRPILNAISLQIMEGEVVALVGPSGSGKSTILNLIGLLETADSGQIFIENDPLPDINSGKANLFRRNRINYLFQTNALVSNYTVKENLLLALHFTSLTAAEKEAQISALLNEVSLAGFEEYKINSLSGGEQQRVAIARTILKPGNIILADEPTGSLDPKLAQHVFDLFYQMAKNHSKTVLMVTHQLDQAQQCDRILSLKAGENGAYLWGSGQPG